MDDLFDILIESGGREARRNASCFSFHLPRLPGPNKKCDGFIFAVPAVIWDRQFSEVFLKSFPLKDAPLRPCLYATLCNRALRLPHYVSVESNT